MFANFSFIECSSDLNIIMTPLRKGKGWGKQNHLMCVILREGNQEILYTTILLLHLKEVTFTIC